MYTYMYICTCIQIQYRHTDTLVKHLHSVNIKQSLRKYNESCSENVSILHEIVMYLWLKCNGGSCY